MSEAKRYQVINWETDEIMAEFDGLNAARRYCKRLGAGPDEGPHFTSLPPIAFVRDSCTGSLIYNPRFMRPKVSNQ